MNNLNELYEAILAGKLEQAVSVTREAVAGGVAPQEIINEYMIIIFTLILNSSCLKSFVKRFVIFDEYQL